MFTSTSILNVVSTSNNQMFMPRRGYASMDDYNRMADDFLKLISDQQHFVSALDRFNGLKVLMPGEYMLIRATCLKLCQRGDLDKAVPLYQVVIDKANTDPYLKASTQPIAQEALRTNPVLAIAEHHVYQAWLNLARIHNARERVDKTIEATEKALHYYPDSLEALVLNAMSHKHKKEPARGLAAIQHALKLEPKDTRARLCYASILFELGRAKESIAEMLSVYASLPRDNALNASQRIYILHKVMDYYFMVIASLFGNIGKKNFAAIESELSKNRPANLSLRATDVEQAVKGMEDTVTMLKSLARDKNNQEFLDYSQGLCTTIILASKELQWSKQNGIKDPNLEPFFGAIQDYYKYILVDFFQYK
ncbi:hypothetical protein SAMD00019534_032370 [Acytostelium subglobosum LB1]|uniref:hypothetical protein n=1 Tax=Acytostelium subglobosum LB1 TaxID=1410327 RepID=UPI000644BBF8|nr:hypothetical protein SAMD00019534_032370 [Acytostelium subglobosum LB1]GAM20062.1 hypothetical protein SAMD00019534_032370 [Acytostelium subglobosum LB1]|eukprot:XP_012756824.1 hypothetical protein SAMD00019534_032370 [Acytostelium subglobosum LB1]